MLLVLDANGPVFTSLLALKNSSFCSSSADNKFVAIGYETIWTTRDCYIYIPSCICGSNFSMISCKVLSNLEKKKVNVYTVLYCLQVN